MRSIARSSNVMVAVGYNGTVLTSSDGNVWHNTDIKTESYLFGVLWNGNKFIAVGANDTVLASVDGIRWENNTKDGSGKYLNYYGTAYGSGKFIAVGGSSTEYVIMSSSDGISWITREIKTGYPLKDIIWTGNMFVAVGYKGTILTSDDGVVWIARMSGTTDDLFGVAWNGSRYVAVGGYYPNGVIFESDDGITWNKCTISSRKPLDSVTWGNGKFVAVSAFENMISTSVDGINWNSISQTVSQTLSSITCGNNMFTALDSAKDVVTSPDGTTWTLSYSYGGSNRLIRIMWAGKRLIGVGGAGLILSAPEGGDLSADNSNAANHLRAIASDGSRFVAAGENNTIIMGSAPNNDAALSNVLLQTGVLNKVFDKQTTRYFVVLTQQDARIPAIRAVPSDNYASVSIANAASFPGTTIITVTAEDGITTKAYSISFVKRSIDCNNDGKVDVKDLAVLSQAYGSTAGDGTGRYKENADFDDNDKIDITDFLLLKLQLN
jgi:hypothetical protein